jgi:tRNA pseudouridine38-40 synthase
VNIKLTVEYDGTDYHGWQVQATGKTVQAVLEQAVSTLVGRPTRIIGSGRTDAGVHALGQVANFLSDQVLEPHRMQRALNALTPDDITVKKA